MITGCIRSREFVELIRTHLQCLLTYIHYGRWRFAGDAIRYCCLKSSDNQKLGKANKQTNRWNKQTDNIRTTPQTFTSTIEQLPDQLHYYYASIYVWFNRLSLLFFFTFFHAVSSLSKDCLTQSSSALSPFDPFLAIDRSYTTCFRSEKVRNSNC